MKTIKVTYKVKGNKLVTDNLEAKNFKSLFNSLKNKEKKGSIRELKRHNTKND